MSPSSRRAWIEIVRMQQGRWTAGVALLAEGVDRNMSAEISRANQQASPSSRRAWIEIDAGESGAALGEVALLAEGVDRNHEVISECSWQSRRPPRGGRG